MDGLVDKILGEKQNILHLYFIMKLSNVDIGSYLHLVKLRIVLLEENGNSLTIFRVAIFIYRSLFHTGMMVAT